MEHVKLFFKRPFHPTFIGNNLLLEDLIRTIRAITTLPEEEEKKLGAVFYSCLMEKGKVFIAAGNIPSKFGFVSKGLFRYSYLNSKGSEFTKGFFPEGSFIVSYSAMVTKTPSFYSIEALEDSEIYVIDYNRWSELYQQHECWKNLLIAMLQKGFMKKERRERELLLNNAEERYRNFLDEYPSLPARVTQNMIASYLGITPVALSRIRSSMQKISAR